MKKTMIVMPVANEEATMAKILDELLGLPYDNLYVYTVLDRFSKDHTEEIVKKYELETGRVKDVFYKDSKGVVSCYLYGFKCALEDGAERVIEMDGGGSHQPCEIPKFIEALDEGYDCVFGSRFIENGKIENNPLYRYALSIGGTWLSNIVLGTNYHDMTSGFEAFQKNVLASMDFNGFLSKGHIYQTEMRYYCRNLNYKEVPIHYIASGSSLKMKSVKEALTVLFRLKKNESCVHNLLMMSRWD